MDEAKVKLIACMNWIEIETRGQKASSEGRKKIQKGRVPFYRCLARTLRSLSEPDHTVYTFLARVQASSGFPSIS